MNQPIPIFPMAFLGASLVSVALAAGAPDADGFESLFNGRDLQGWHGDPAYWRVEEGCLVGEITPDKLLKQNSWIVWRDGEVGDFELRCEYWVSAAGNSGIGYRCEELPVSLQ